MSRLNWNNIRAMSIEQLEVVLNGIDADEDVDALRDELETRKYQRDMRRRDKEYCEAVALAST